MEFVEEKLYQKKIVMNVFYVNSAVHQAQDVVEAFEKVRDLVRGDRNIKTITFLVGQQNQFNMLAPLKFSAKHIANQGFTTSDGYHIQFKTLRNYHPDYVFSNHMPSEILVAICIPSQNLYQFEDYSNIAYWIIVPWTIDENESFLSIHEAEDCATGTLHSAPAALDGRIANAIDWLKDTSYPNEGYHHPNDENRLKNMAVKLKKMHIPVDYDAVVYYCLNHGLVPSAARKTADYFERAQTHPMRISDPYNNLESIINAPRD